MRNHHAAVRFASALLLPAAALAQSPAPLLLRQPGLSATDICFTYGGDLWTVPRAGGAAHRLTASPGTETGCRYSRDGRWIAYTNTLNKNPDVYVIPAGGGSPKRLTWRPSAEVVRGWTDDGRVLFVSDRDGIALTVALGAPRLFAQAPDAVRPTPVDLPSAWDGAANAWRTCPTLRPTEPGNGIAAAERRRSGSPPWPTLPSRRCPGKAPPISSPCGSATRCTS